MNQRTEAGDQYGYVGEILDPNWSPEIEPAPPVEAPLRDDMLSMPRPGVYFGMPEEQYHAIGACSTSELKRQRTSSMEVWAYSRRNPDFEERQAAHFDHGKAAHCLVLEGEAEYQRRFVVQLDPEEFADQSILFSTDEVKAAISRHRETRPVAPVGTNKQQLIDQLDALSVKHGVEVSLEGTVPELKDRIRSFEEEQPVSPVSRVEVTDADGNTSSRAAVKADWIDQLLKLDSQAKVWDRMVEEHLDLNKGKRAISAKDDRQVRIAAHMIQRHNDAAALLKGGFPEVSIFWYCRLTGAPMKARIDYLRLNAIIDLKTFSNASGKPVNKAILHSIANYNYNLQHVVYEEAVMEARRMVGRDLLNSVFDCDDPTTEEAARRQTFCERWAEQGPPPKFTFIFQQSGIAPVTRVFQMPQGEIWKASHRMAEELKRLWVENTKVYGLDPWIDNEPMTEIEDEMIPSWATEMGNYYD